MTYELVYIGAAWCATCKTIKPQLQELCKKFSIAMKELDYDKDLSAEEQELVTKVPTVRILKTGIQIAEFNVRQVASTEAWLTANVTLQTTDDF
jgi:thiol-disulfide isomerase/thioredoxin